MPKRKQSDINGTRRAYRTREKRALMTQEEWNRLLAQSRKASARARANETEEQRAERLFKVKAYSRKIRKKKKEKARRAERLLRKAEAERKEAERAERLSRKAEAVRNKAARLSWQAQAERDEAERAARLSQEAEAERKEAERAEILSRKAEAERVKLNLPSQTSLDLSKHPNTASKKNSKNQNKSNPKRTVKSKFMPSSAASYAIPWVDYTSCILKCEEEEEVNEEPNQDPLEPLIKTENNFL